MQDAGSKTRGASARFESRPNIGKPKIETENRKSKLESNETGITKQRNKPAVKVQKKETELLRYKAPPSSPAQQCKNWRIELTRLANNKQRVEAHNTAKVEKKTQTTTKLWLCR